MEALRLASCVQATLEVEPSSLRGFVAASQLDGNNKTPFPVCEGASRYNLDAQAYEFHHTAEDHSKGVRGYFGPLMEATKCHQDVQVNQHGQENYAAYTAKYAPKFSDSMEEELLNDDADANSIAASVLSRYKPCVPEMALQLFGSVFRQWHIGTYSGGRRTLNVPTPDVDPAPKPIELYENSSWRAEDMTLLDYLRKTNDQGEIAGWLRAQWRSAGQPGTLQGFANACRPQGEKVVACGVGSRLRDKFYGQWLLLNVPFRSRSALLLPEIAERVPLTDRWLATCVFCPQAKAIRVWDSEAAIEEDMLLEGHGRLHRQEVLGYFRAQSALARQCMTGALEKPAPGPAATRAGRTHVLPIQKRYAELIATGAKTIEGRLNCGVAALVKAGDRLRLGPVHCKVAEVKRYASFEEMLRSTSWQAAIPDVGTLQEALDVYHSFANYEDLARRCGVLAFHLLPADAENTPAAPAWNAEQSRWLRVMEEDLARAAAVHFADTEAESDAARAETWRCNRIRALEGPPGTGKTTVAKELVEKAVGHGLRVLWTVYTAQLASRMRQEFGGGVDVDTCHAALGLGQEIAECGLNLACYDLVILDEFSQLEARHFAHAVHLHNAVDKTPAFGLLGDRRQLAGYGTERPWHSPLWRAAVHHTQLHDLFRCKDEKFRRVLGALRTAKPTATGPRGGVSVADIVRGRRAWRGGQPKTADIARLLRDHPGTTLLAITRRGAATFNNLAVQALFLGRRVQPGELHRHGPAEAREGPASHAPGGLRGHGHLHDPERGQGSRLRERDESLRRVLRLCGPRAHRSHCHRASPGHPAAGGGKLGPPRLLPHQGWLRQHRAQGSRRGTAPRRPMARRGQHPRSGLHGHEPRSPRRRLVVRRAADSRTFLPGSVKIGAFCESKKKRADPWPANTLSAREVNASPTRRRGRHAAQARTRASLEPSAFKADF